MSSLSALPHKIPDPILNRLRALRRRILGFMLVDGLGRVFLVVVGLILADLVLDRYFKMDFAQRLIMLCVMLGVVAVVAFLRLLRPLARRPGDDALILQVEERNEQLQESVISSAQMARDARVDRQGVSPAMVRATIDHGAAMAQSIDFGSVVDRSAFARNIALLLVGVLSIGGIGFGVGNTDMWRTWFNRNILLTDDAWPKNTQLQIVGVEDNRLILLRGEDHQQLVIVDENSRVKDVEVSLEFDDGSSRTIRKMRVTGELDGREHLLVFRNLSSEFEFRALGGDDTTDWVHVSLVEPPGWARLDLVCHLPLYTGIATQTLPEGSGPHSVLSGSWLSISGTANKPLTEAQVRLGETQWSLQADELGTEFTLQIPADELLGGKYIFDLADESAIRSSRPTSFTLKIKPDREPQVRASLLGISGLVVPRVRIPVSFSIDDDFAVEQVHFSHEWRSDSGSSIPSQTTTALTDLEDLGQAELRSVQVLDMEPLGIPIGVGLRLAVHATDNNTLTGPGVGSSNEFLLRVVSEEELREDLLRREIEQRQAFEVALKNQESLSVEVRVMIATLQGSSPTNDEELTNELRVWQRRQKLVATNITTIADRFDEFLVEVKNNRLDEAEAEIDDRQSIEQRLVNRIIDPIRDLDQVRIIQVLQEMDLCQRSISEKDSLLANLRQTDQTQEEIVIAMREILAAMEDSETYQEIVNRVIELKRGEERIREELNKKRDKKDIFDDGKGLFDKENDPPQATDPGK